MTALHAAAASGKVLEVAAAKCNKKYGTHVWNCYLYMLFVTCLFHICCFGLGFGVVLLCIVDIRFETFYICSYCLAILVAGARLQGPHDVLACSCDKWKSSAGRCCKMHQQVWHAYIKLLPVFVICCLLHVCCILFAISGLDSEWFCCAKWLSNSRAFKFVRIVWEFLWLELAYGGRMTSLHAAAASDKVLEVAVAKCSKKYGTPI